LKPVRLNRFLALAGVASRRRCDEIVRSGRVAIDGQRVDDPARSVDPDKQRVTLDGKPLAAVAPCTWLLNKPRGVLSAASDARGGRTVLDLAREAGIEERLYPVGRLDKDSRGLILLSNEGDLALRLTHPRYGVEKTYRVNINLPITATQQRRFAGGLPLEDGTTRPCRIRPLPGRASYEIVIAEGRKRQIRRMFEAMGRRVTDLRRVRLGPLALGALREGELRQLSSAELQRLKQAVGLR
jgi:23S rRNA pseudouridine2605 synthase